MKIDINHCGIYQRTNGVWYWWTIVDGKKYQRSTECRTKARATKFLKDLIGQELKSCENARLFKNFVVGIFDHDTGPIAQRKLMRGYTYTRAYARTMQTYIRKYAVPAFGEKDLADIRPKPVEDWLLSLPGKYGITNKTANNVLCALRQVFEVAVFQELIERNPAEHVKPLAKDGKRRGCYTVEQVRQIFSKVWEHRQAYVACLLSASTGMRLGEIRALTVEQVHNGYIEVNASWNDLEGRKCTKSGYGRMVPISKTIQDQLNAILPPEGLIFSYNGIAPMYDGALIRPLYQRMEELGIDHKAENLTFHSFRHFFNTRLVAAGIAGEKARAVIGHESTAMTEHYLHLDSSDLSEIRSVQEDALGI